MDTTLMGRGAVRALAVVLLTGGVAIGLAACQSSSAAPAGSVPDTAREEQHGVPMDPRVAERYAGRPADRIEEEILRDARDGMPSTDCVRHVVVEHPDGGYHLTCVQTAE